MSMNYNDYKDKLVEFDYLTTKGVVHIRGYVRIEDNYSEDDCLLDVEVAPHWTRIFIRACIRNFKEVEK